MAPKRGAASQGGRAAKKAAVDPFDEALNDALALLPGTGVGESAKQMLTVAAPFCLRSPAADRHVFQTEIVTALQEMFKGVESRQEEQVQGAEAEATDFSSKLQACGEELKSLTAKATEAKEAADSANKAAEDATAAVKTAESTLKAEKGKEETMETDHKQLLEQKTEREALVGETWAKLKTETTWGKDWRKRDKMIEGVLEVLAEMAAVEESLKLCLPVAMKAKPDGRGHFAQQTIEHCEVHLKKSLADLEEKISGHDGQVEALKAAIAAAEAAVQAAKEDGKTKDEELVTALNAKMEAEEKEKAIQESHKEMEAKDKELKAKLDEAKSSCANVAAVLKRFQAVAESGAAGAAPPEVVAEDAGAEGEAAPAQEATA